ncbi:MAG: sugar ABC transporter permease [Clostridia bacterium]|nr:sugar ABC transporter permease [Clostridia bacterium]
MTGTLKTRQMSLGNRIWQARYLYLLLLPGLIWFVIWCYIPMDGVLLAFKKYNAKLGVFGSQWVGMTNFRRIFITPAAIQAIKNTLQISLTRLMVEFPVPIILALFVNEIRGRRTKKILQTVFTFPHFLSWVVVSLILSNFLSASGLINTVLESFGFQKVNILATVSFFRPLLYMTSNWKEAGWSSIIYLAAITSIDPALYEAAQIDGASRFQQALYITLTGIRETIVLLLILAVGGMMNAGFDQIFNMQNGGVKQVSQIIDTYVYEITFQAAPNYGFSAAVGIFKSGINLILMLAANFVAKRISGTGLFG